MARLFKNLKFINQMLSTRIAQFTSLFKPIRPLVAVTPAPIPDPPLRWLAPNLSHRFAFHTVLLPSSPYAGIRRQFIKPYTTTALKFSTHITRPFSPTSLIGTYHVGGDRLVGIQHASSLSSSWEGLVDNIRRGSLSSVSPSLFPTEPETNLTPTTTNTAGTPVTPKSVSNNVHISMFLYQSAAVELSLDTSGGVKNMASELRTSGRAHKKHLYAVAATLEKLETAGVNLTSYSLQGRDVGVIELVIPLPVSSLEEATRWLKTNGISVPSPHFDLEIPAQSTVTIAAPSASSSVSPARKAEIEEFLRDIGEMAKEDRQFAHFSESKL